MERNKKGSSSNLTCDVCKINFNTNADYALHEFSKKHCDNLIRLAKQKPVVSKQKSKSETLPVEKQLLRENSVAPSVSFTGSLAKYGYFIRGEIYANAESTKDFNIDYDPYLQKFAKNPFKEKPGLPSANESSAFNSVINFSKKKKKKIKTCQVCNVTLTTVPDYEAHMKSPQHIWKLKVTGMGVSAHFVKASSDLHTTDMSEKSNFFCKNDKQNFKIMTNISETTAVGPFPLLHCSDCKLLLDSPQQYNAHIQGKPHIECAQRKAELKAKKEKLKIPSPNQLYCYSCKISLNNLFQYNEHKNGKKHKTKCRNLVRDGISIPPEERVPGIPLPNPNKPVVYPELYEKVVLKSQGQTDSEVECVPESVVHENNRKVESREIAELFSAVSYETENSVGVQGHPDPEKSLNAGATNEVNRVTDVTENHYDTNKTPKSIFYKKCTQTGALDINPDKPTLLAMDSQTDTSNHLKDPVNCVKNTAMKISEHVLTTIMKCSICDEIFDWQFQLDTHLATEDHLKKILEHKLNGSSETDLLNALFSDRNVIKANSSGKLTCSICNVTTGNCVELDQHLNSVVHKYTQKDYRMKRTIEVKHMTASNEDGLYFCKTCEESWPSLVDYTQHLHFVKHKSLQRVQRAKAVLAKKRASHLQKPRRVQSLKKRNLSLRKVKAEKNPGVRTKVCGVSLDLNSGIKAPISNLEPLEPKIDVAKNVSIGVCGKVIESTTFGNENKSEEVKIKKGSNAERSNRQRNGPHNDSMRFVPSGNAIPPLMSSPPFRPRFPRPCYAMPNRNWMPFSSPSATMFGPFCEGPTVGNPYVRPLWFQRTPWPGYR